MDPMRLTGYWKGGVGYDIQVSITEPKLTGSTVALKASFQCFFRGKGAVESMTCNSVLRKLAEVPGFNGLILSLAAPHPSLLEAGSAAQGALTVRTSVDASVGNDRATRFYDLKREFTCEYGS